MTPAGRLGRPSRPPAFSFQLLLPICLCVFARGASAALPGAESVKAPSSFPPIPLGWERDWLDADGVLKSAVAGSGEQAGFIDERGASHEGPSRAKTVLFSALVPGLGQLMHGERGYGGAFLAGEVASWTSFAVFRVQGEVRKDRFVEYAERFAGVDDASGQSDDYYSALASYDRSGDPGGPDSYNEVEVRQHARDDLYPDDPAAQEAYIQEHSITGAQAWDWESDARRREFSAIRIASENGFHRSQYSVGAMVAGRILSVMHAIWFTAEPDKSEGAAKSAVRPYAGYRKGESRLGFRYRF